MLGELVVLPLRSPDLLFSPNMKTVLVGGFFEPKNLVYFAEVYRGVLL